MRYDFSLYFLGVVCFVSGGFLFMDYSGYIQLTTGNEVTDLVLAMFSWILGLVFIGLGYGVRPKKDVPTHPLSSEPSGASEPAKAKSGKKPKKKAVRKRYAKKKT